MCQQIVGNGAMQDVPYMMAQVRVIVVNIAVVDVSIVVVVFVVVDVVTVSTSIS